MAIASSRVLRAAAQVLVFVAALLAFAIPAQAAPRYEVVTRQAAIADEIGNGFALSPLLGARLSGTPGRCRAVGGHLPVLDRTPTERRPSSITTSGPADQMAVGHSHRVIRVGLNEKTRKSAGYGYDDASCDTTAVQFVAKETPCPNSFVPATIVLMADGTRKRIADVKVGDKVLASDPDTGKSEPHEVVDLITGEGEKHLVDVKVRTKDGLRTIVATRGHPFWVDDQGRWLRADQLRSGDELRGPDGSEFPVARTREHVEFLKVHNLTIEGVHTYYVLAGNQPVLVHNARRPVTFPNTSDPNGIEIRRSPTGEVTNYAVYDKNGIIEYRVDLVGKPHGGIPTPHVTPYNHYVDPETGELKVNALRNETRPAVPGVEC